MLAKARTPKTAGTQQKQEPRQQMYSSLLVINLSACKHLSACYVILLSPCTISALLSAFLPSILYKRVKNLKKILKKSP
jgi:hypothetical protein